MIRNLSGQNGQGGAEFYCDVCGELISSLEGGRVVLVGRTDEPGMVSDVRHVHAGKCLARAEDHAEGGWISLESHLRSLCRNYGMKEVGPPHEGTVDVVL